MVVLLLLATVFLCVAADWLLRRRREQGAQAPGAGHPAGLPVRLPQGVFFARSHTWLNLQPAGRAWLGIDDFVVRLLDRPRVRFLQQAGGRVHRGEPLFALEDGVHRLTVRSPIEATVVSLNPRLARHSVLPAQAPLCESWTHELRPERSQDLKGLLLGDEVSAWMKEEFRRLRDVLAGAGPGVSPAMLQDGGPPIAGGMRHAPPEAWRRFEQEFLEVR